MIGLQLLDRRPLVWLAAGALVLLTVAAQFASLATPDMGFLLYAAGKVLDGARLYRDIVEINPPLIVALNLPVVAGARAFGVPEFPLYRLASATGLTALLTLCRSILRSYVAPEQPRFRRALLLALVVVLFPLSAEDFGEREQFVIAAFLPYLLVIAARLRGNALPRPVALSAGLLAGVSVALKPHFMIVWISVELFRAVRHHGSRHATLELWSAFAFLLVYAAAVALLTPEYFILAMELGRPYTTYLRIPWTRLLALAPGAALVWFALLAAVVARRNGRERGALALVAVATVSCFAAAVAQQKGLRYHFYPALALAIVLVTLTEILRSRPVSWVDRLYGVAGRLLLATTLVATVVQTMITALGGTRTQRRVRGETLALASFVRERAAGEPIAVLSYHIASAFPLINYARVPFASRFPHLWLLPACYWEHLGSEEPLRYRAFESMAEPERFLNRAVREDLIRSQPRVLLVLRPAPDARRYFLRRLDYLAYFGRQPVLAEFFAGYQLVGARGEYDVYERHAGPEASPTIDRATALRRSNISTPIQTSPNTIKRARE